MVRLLSGALDLHLAIEATASAGEFVAVRASSEGTHIGGFGGLAASGRTFAASMMPFEHIIDGRIAERWEIADNASVIEQLTADG